MGRLDKIRDHISTIKLLDVADSLMRASQAIAALVVSVLFGIGVFDLILEIIDVFQSGRITEVSTVIGIIEFVLLLFIIVEAYRTIVAYVREQEAKYILTLVIYAGIIAVIRKIIVFRPQEYTQAQDAFMTAGSYAVLLFSLAILVLIVDKYGSNISQNLTDSD